MKNLEKGLILSYHRINWWMMRWHPGGMHAEELPKDSKHIIFKLSTLVVVFRWISWKSHWKCCQQQVCLPYISWGMLVQTWWNDHWWPEYIHIHDTTTLPGELLNIIFHKRPTKTFSWKVQYPFHNHVWALSAYMWLARLAVYIQVFFYRINHFHTYILFHFLDSFSSGFV